MFISYLGEVGKGLEELSAEDISKYREHLIKIYYHAGDNLPLLPS